MMGTAVVVMPGLRTGLGLLDVFSGWFDDSQMLSIETRFHLLL